MHTALLRGFFTAAALTAALAGQAAKAPEKPAPPEEAAQQPAPSTEELIDQLGDSAAAVRRLAEQQLRQQGKSSLEALEGAAEHHDDPEVRWRARRLARQIERGGAPGGLRPRGQEPQRAPGRARPVPGGANLDDMFDSLFQRLERDFGMDVPRRRFFGDDFFMDLQRQMDEARQRMQQHWSDVDQLGPGVRGRADAMQFRMGPNGVKLEVEERTDDGKVETKTYAAPDLETFREKYPEVAKRHLGGDGSMRLRLWRPGVHGGAFGLRSWDDAQRDDAQRDEPPQDEAPSDDAPQTDAPQAATGPRLGVYVRPVGDDLRAFLALPQGQGLVVDSVEPDSLAARLGLREGDVLLEVAARAVGSTDDVREALQAAGDKVQVRINRRGVEETLEADG